MLNLIILLILNLHLFSCNELKTNEIFEIPKFIKVCNKTDPKLNECVRNSIELLRPFITTGIAEFGIPVCEPLVIPKIELKQDSGAIKLHSKFTNITVYGPSKFQLEKLRIDPIRNRFRMKLWFPEMKMKANYEMNGNILMMPLVGNGMCYGNYSDIEVVAAMKGQTYINKTNNLEYLKVNDFFIEYNVGNASVMLNNLFNGDPELGRSMNRFINENWKLVAAEMRPAVEDSISEFLLRIANIIFSRYPLNYLLPS